MALSKAYTNTRKHGKCIFAKLHKHIYIYTVWMRCNQPTTFSFSLTLNPSSIDIYIYIDIFFRQCFYILGVAWIYCISVAPAHALTLRSRGRYMHKMHKYKRQYPIFTVRFSKCVSVFRASLSISPPICIQNFFIETCAFTGIHPITMGVSTDRFYVLYYRAEQISINTKHAQSIINNYLNLLPTSRLLRHIVVCCWFLCKWWW